MSEQSMSREEMYGLALAALEVGVSPVPYKTITSGVRYRAAEWAQTPPKFYGAFDGYDTPLGALVASAEEMELQPISLLTEEKQKDTVTISSSVAKAYVDAWFAPQKGDVLVKREALERELALTFSAVLKGDEES